MCARLLAHSVVGLACSVLCLLGQASLRAYARLLAHSVFGAAVQPKPKFRFSGPVTYPVDRERVEAPPELPRPPPGWQPVCYRAGPAPQGKVLGTFKVYKTNAKRIRPLAGLSMTYQRPLQPEALQPPAEDGEQGQGGPAAEEEELRQMERWAQRVREWEERREQAAAQQQQGRGP